jgi:hypothetical protein
MRQKELFSYKPISFKIKTSLEWGALSFLTQCKGFLNNLVLILARTEREQNEAKKHFEHKKAPFCFLNRPTTNCELNVKKR